MKAIDFIKRGGSVQETRSLFQARDGGSIPTSPHNFRIGICEFKDIRYIFEAFHYKGGHMGGGISICFGLYDQSRLVGGAVLGKMRQEKAYSKYGKSIEIRRMACLDEAPKNTESYFLSKIIWYVKKHHLADTIISYADSSVGHTGVIYRAANFKLIGMTAPSKHVVWNGTLYHPRSLSINRDYSFRIRNALKKGEANVETSYPKEIYAYFLSPKLSPVSS